MKATGTIPCIVCAVDLPNMASPKVDVHPYDGLHFRSYGHYGSSIFDPMSAPAHLDVAICDVCIMAHLDKVRGTGKGDLADNVQLYTAAAHHAKLGRESKNVK